MYENIISMWAIITIRIEPIAIIKVYILKIFYQGKNVSIYIYLILCLFSSDHSYRSFDFLYIFTSIYYIGIWYIQSNMIYEYDIIII